jgi:hypothetical protein
MLLIATMEHHNPQALSPLWRSSLSNIEVRLSLIVLHIDVTKSFAIADGENKETMDVTATQKYFTDVGVSFEDVDVFIASHIVQSPSFGEITKDGFVKGWAELQ